MKKRKRIEIRVDDFDEKLIKIKAKECGLSTSEYVRKCALNKTLPKALTEEELEIYRDFKKFHNYFSAISNLFRKGNYPKMVEEIELLKAEMKQKLQQISKK